MTYLQTWSVARLVDAMTFLFDDFLLCVYEFCSTASADVRVPRKGASNGTGSGK